MSITAMNVMQVSSMIASGNILGVPASVNQATLRSALVLVALQMPRQQQWGFIKFGTDCTEGPFETRLEKARHLRSMLGYNSRRIAALFRSEEAVLASVAKGMSAAAKTGVAESDALKLAGEMEPLLQKAEQTGQWLYLSGGSYRLPTSFAPHDLRFRQAILGEFLYTAAQWRLIPRRVGGFYRRMWDSVTSKEDAAIRAELA